MRKGVFIGFFLISLPVALLLLSSIPVTRTDTVIDVSFVLEPGKKYDTAHHTRILGRSVLKGVVSVEGEGINFSKDGALHPLYVDREYNFTIDPAYDLYFFNFDNTKGDNKSFVSFLLKEEWTGSRFPLAGIFGWFGVVLLAPVGLIILIISYYRSSHRLVASDRRRETREIAARIAMDPEKLYGRILDAYAYIHGSREVSKKRLERKIDRHMKLGLTREEAIIKIAEDEKVISYQEKQEEVRIPSPINLKGVTIGGIGGSIFGFVGGFILGPVVWHTPAHTARAGYPVSLFCYIIGALISGFVAAKMAHSKGMINGLCAGIFNLIIWEVIAPVIALWIGLTRFPEILWLWGGYFVPNLFAVTIFGSIGGFLGEKASLAHTENS